MLDPAAAAAVIAAWMPRVGTEARPLRSAIGAILREEVMPERENPPFDRVCMDGIAICSVGATGGRREFHMQGTVAAGAVPPPLADPAHALEVMTGAVLPPGTDCVVPLEEYLLAGGQLTLAANCLVKPWRNIQRRGEDSRPGVPMLHVGQRLGPAELAVVASAGLASVQVSSDIRVAVVSTGDELVEPGLPIAGHQVRRSNAYAIVAALQAHGGVHVVDEHLPDDEARTRERLGELLAAHDVLVLSGGVSKGRFDFVPSALRQLGVTEQFHEVAQRPGRPLWFGSAPGGQVVFGLPGNPVAALACLVRFVLPALDLAAGAIPNPPERIALADAIEGRRMTTFLPVKVSTAGGIASIAIPRPPNGSGDFLALAGTTGFVELPPRPEGYPAGFTAELYRW
jgi:molybdopterin molybdotransferase